MLKGKMKKFFAAMLVTAMVCPTMVYADTLDAAPFDGDLVLDVQDDQQFLSEEPSDEIVIDEEEGSDQEPFYEEEYDPDQAAFEADEEYSYSADEDTYNGGLEPDGDTPSVEAVGLATGWLKNPLAAPNLDNWHHVYFGKYNNQPVSYRVLEITPGETSQNPPKTNVLLDCDVLLYDRKYNDPQSASAAGNEWRPWKDSDLKPNVDNCFGALYSAVEQNAIKTVSIADGEDNVESKVYLFSKDDVTNASYGITMDRHRIKNIIGTTTPASWWLRTTDTTSEASEADAYIVKADGSIDTEEKCNMAAFPVLPYVSPVININPASVIYTSRIGGSGYSFGTKYKFTLKDSDLSIALQGGTSVTRSVNTITVPYSITDNDTVNDPTRVSLLLLKHSYTAGKAVYDATNATGIKEFCIIPQNGSYAGLTGTATFTLPDEYEDAACGSGYYAYLIAEDVNGAYETNYASAPFQITVPALTKKAVTVTYGGNGSASADKATAAEGQTVTLTANPDEGYGLKEWTVTPAGAVTIVTNEDGSSSFVMGNTDVTINAVFAPKSSVTVSKDESGTGDGTVSANVESAIEGQIVTITAEPDDDSLFAGWTVSAGNVTFSGSSATSTNSTETFTMGSQPVVIKATFNKIPRYSTTFEKGGTGTGEAEVTSTNPAIEGSIVTIKATPAEGSVFEKWEILTEGVTFKTSGKTTSTNPDESFT
ncbi:MAG: hypothetical protein IKQ40_02520, partial [Lachnospiraceae bacterium]|nr:hypothetical protein [Lachnospiraceae bacterium]